MFLMNKYSIKWKEAYFVIRLEEKVVKEEVLIEFLEKNI